MEDIFKYLDYREYLRAHFNYNKGCHRFFSFRYVAGKTGLDASFYVKVLNKQKHIANNAIPALISFLKLNKREGCYFTTLVHLNKAKSSDQETFYLQKLLLLRNTSATVLDNDLYEYFSSWWNVVIREELNIIDFKDDYDDLASRLHPSITTLQARRSIKLLEKLGLAKTDDNGFWRPTRDFITNNGVDHAKAIRSYQKALIKLAGSAINTISPEKRDISTLTVSSSYKCLETIRERLNEIRREIIEMVRNDGSTEEVYQINFQIFPLTINGERNEKP